MDAIRKKSFKPGEVVQRGINRKGKPVYVTFLRYIYVSAQGRMAMIEYRKARQIRVTQEIVYIHDLTHIE